MAAEQTIHLDRYAPDAKALVASAQSLADERKHAQVEPVHLLARAIERDRGVFVFSDTDAHGLGEKPQHVYSVRFTARELWGEKVSGRDSVYVDMWDDYLEPA